MESVKEKLGILALILSLVIIAAAIWYCVGELPNGKGAVMDGTLVRQVVTGEGMRA